MCLTEVPYLLPWSLDTLPVTAAFVLTGYGLKSFWLRQRRGAVIFAGLVAAALLMRGIYEVNGGANLSIRSYGRAGLLSVPLYYLTGVCCFVSFAWLMRLGGACLPVKALARIGRLSLTLMCLHLPLSPLMLPFTRFCSPLVAASLYLLLLIFLCIPLEWLYKRLARRFPLAGYLAT